MAAEPIELDNPSGRRLCRHGALVENDDISPNATPPAFKMLVSYAHGLERAIAEVEIDRPPVNESEVDAKNAAAAFLDKIEEVVIQLRGDLFATLPSNRPGWSTARRDRRAKRQADAG